MPYKKPEDKKAQQARWRARNPNYQKQWLMKHPDYLQKWREKHPDYKGGRHTAEYYRQYYLQARRSKVLERYRLDAEFRLKQLARSCVTNALRAGKIARKPCHVCGVEKDIHAHHNDYNKALDVIWLCKKHHLAIHNGAF